MMMRVLFGAITSLGAMVTALPVMAQATAPVQATAIPPRIPTELLADQPFLSRPQLSPDGNKLAAWLSIKGKEALAVIDLASGKRRFLDLGKYDLNWFRWAGNDTLLISAGLTVPWMDDEAWQTRLLAFDYATDQTRFIGGKTEGLKGDDVLWIDPAGTSILLAYQQTIYDYPGVYQVDLATNKSKNVVQQRVGVWDWYADDKGAVRVGIVDTNTGWKMLYRANGKDSFRTVVSARDGDDEAGFDAFRIYQGSDEGFRVLLNEQTGRYALYKFNFATRQRGELVLDAPGVDVDDFDTRYDSNQLYAAWYTDDRPRVKWFDADLASVQEMIDKAVPGVASGERQAVLTALNRDHDRMVVWIGGSSDPGRYYFYDTAGGKLQPFAKVNERLDPAQLAKTTYTHYTARDGLDVPAYLTLPRGRVAKNLPLVILPHGGPYDVRDDGTFDAEVQLLANRGYVVLQPEYRGSGGYGKAFYEKGEGQWGRAMQDDLDDGMDWLAKQGVIDPKRVCLVGGSYGGYAALWGAVRNPERYRCAASFAGISDLKRQLKFQIEFKVSKRYRKDWRKTVQGEDAFDLRTVSPLFQIDRLKVPVLLAHGDEDQRVPYKQSKLYADALQQAGKPFEFYTLKGEGHGFSSSANQQLWFDKLDAFLAKYNPAD